jgi:hypothetical protein
MSGPASAAPVGNFGFVLNSDSNIRALAKITIPFFGIDIV